MKRKAIPNRRSRLFKERIALVLAVVEEEVRAYLLGEIRRSCLTCGRKFVARTRRHLFCVPGCRVEWYRGQFFPKARNR